MRTFETVNNRNFAFVIGAGIFSNFGSFAGFLRTITGWVRAMDVGPWTLMFCIILMYLVLDAALESLSMILLTVPIVFPLVTPLDSGPGLLSDPEMVVTWFGIVAVVVTEMNLISPPIGLNVLS